MQQQVFSHEGVVAPCLVSGPQQAQSHLLSGCCSWVHHQTASSHRLLNKTFNLTPRKRVMPTAAATLRPLVRRDSSLEQSTNEDANDYVNEFIIISIENALHCISAPQEGRGLGRRGLLKTVGGCTTERRDRHALKTAEDAHT